MNFQTLESEGGKLAIIIFMLLWLSIVAAIMHITGHDPAETGRSVIIGAVSSLLGILYTKLGSKDKTG